MSRFVVLSRMAIVILSLLLLATCSQVLAQTLVRAHDSPNVYFVDRFGIRHHVTSPEVREQFFGHLAVARIRHGELARMPLGGPITFDTPPYIYNRHPDRYAADEYGPRHWRHGRVYEYYGAPPIFRPMHGPRSHHDF